MMMTLKWDQKTRMWRAPTTRDIIPIEMLKTRTVHLGGSHLGPQYTVQISRTYLNVGELFLKMFHYSYLATNK